MANHAKASPSKLSALEKCACYWSDPNKQNDAAEEGTLMHEATETEDLSALAEDEQREAVGASLMYLQILKAGRTPRKENKEVKVKSDLTFGIVDHALEWDDDTADILDWKYGRNAVDPADTNLQGQAYAYCYFHENEDINEITVHFVQPRLHYVTTHTYKRDPDYETIRTRILEVLERFNDEDKKPTPHEKACQYCDLKANCSALTEIAMEVVKQTTGLPLPSEFEPGKLVTEKDRSTAQVLAGILEDWASQVKKNNAQATKEEGLEIPGFDLRERVGGQKAINPTAILNATSEHYGIDRTALESTVTLSLPKISDAVHLYKGGDKKAIKEEILRINEESFEERPSVIFLQRKRKLSDDEILKLEG